MPKFQCRCGFVFDFSRSPCDGEYLLTPDAIVAELLDAENLACEAIVEAIDAASLQVLLCPQCKRLWLQTVHDAHHFVEYVIAPKLA
jgi:hypothetical protein